MTISKNLQVIKNGIEECSIEELNDLFEILRHQFNVKENELKNSFKVGMICKCSNRPSTLYKVIKINPKYIQCKEVDSNGNVKSIPITHNISPALLEPVGKIVADSTETKKTTQSTIEDSDISMVYTQKFPTDDDDDDNNWRKNLNYLDEIDKIQESKGESLLYRYFFVDIADGKAYYQVIGVTPKNVTIKRCSGLCPDEYYDDVLGYDERTLPKKTIEPLVKRRIALEKFYTSSTSSIS